MIKTYIIKIQSRRGCWLSQEFPFKWSSKTKILNRIIQSKMILIQDKKFWAWTEIGIDCRNIGPLTPRNILNYINRTEKLVCLIGPFSNFPIFSIFDYRERSCTTWKNEWRPRKQGKGKSECAVHIRWALRFELGPTSRRPPCTVLRRPHNRSFLWVHRYLTPNAVP